MAEPREDAWPTVDEPTLLTSPPVPPPAPFAPAPPPPDRRIGAGMLLALGAIGLVAIGVLLALLLTRHGSSQTTTVLVTNTPTQQATAPTTSSPAAGGQVAVPDLVGGSLSDAKAQLKKLGLGAAVTPVTTTGKQPGTVVDEAPKPGQKLPANGVVTLSVARAPTSTTGTTTAGTTSTTTATTPAQPASATMPDVGGQTEQAAVTSLNRAGLLASLFFVPASDPLGTVMQQAKAAGTTLPYHAHVQLNVSRGPGEKPDEQVPDVVGRSLTDAVSALNAAHLRLIYVRFTVGAGSRAGTIVQQSPLAGGKAPQNAQVLVFLGVRG